MDQQRFDAVLPHLPEAGDPLLVVPGGKIYRGRVFWRSGDQTWLAPVHRCGLVCWSRSHTPNPVTSPRLAASLEAPNLLDRVRGEESFRPGLLPQPGQPLLLNFDLRVAYWSRRGRLMHGPWFDDGLLGWGPVGMASREDALPEERVAIDHAVRMLREATPGGPQTNLLLPERDGQACDIVVANRSISSRPRPVGSHDELLHLRTEDGYRLHVGDAVVLDGDMALDLAAEMAAHPGAAVGGSDEPRTRVVRHPEPDCDDGTLTIWRVDDGLAILHDLNHAPFTVWLRSQQDHPLTEARALRLASALAAAAELLDRVRYLAVTALRRDHRRHTTVRTEADFAATVLAAKR